MNCPNCGRPVAPNAHFCSACGSSLPPQEPDASDTSHPDKAPQPPSEPPLPTSRRQAYALNQDDELRLFVGEKKADYYLKKWKSASNPLARSGWNWAAFFLTVFWLGYRKMYAWVLGIFGFFIAMDLGSYLLHSNDSSNTSYGAVFSLVFGFFGNALYYKHALSKIAAVKRQHKAPEEQWKAIAQKGGTSWGGFWLVVLLLAVEISINALLLQNSSR